MTLYTPSLGMVEEVVQVSADVKVYEDQDGTYYAECVCGWQSPNFDLKEKAVICGRTHEGEQP
jgi:hypothetical protein